MQNGLDISKTCIILNERACAGRAKGKWKNVSGFVNKKLPDSFQLVVRNGPIKLGFQEYLDLDL